MFSFSIFAFIFSFLADEVEDDPRSETKAVDRYFGRW